MKSKGLPTDSPLRWLEWNRINAAGRDAHYRGAYAEADRLFEELLMITKELAPPAWHSILSGMKEASGWWQAEIVRKGVHDWNLWRQANPGARPDLRGQNLSLEDPAPPYSPDYELQRPRWGIRDLSGINFESADLTSACLYFSDLSDANLRAANMQDANLEECGLSGANLTDAIGLTQVQLESAYGDLETKLPVGLKRPFSWNQASDND